jgi:carbamoyl-phosphate synthase small subunit
MKGRLVLEDGTVFEGEVLGSQGKVSGEVVFTTNMTGYQEVLTDPSFCGQIVAMTYPLVGNYGFNHSNSQSAATWVRGFVVREACELPSHYQSSKCISEYLCENQVVGLTGVDTRSLAKHIRDCGSMRGVICTNGEDTSELVRFLSNEDSASLLEQVTTPRPYRIMGDGPRVVVLDLGIKTGILRQMMALDFDISVMPADTPVDVLADMKMDGLFLSNGPGNPEEAEDAIEAVTKLAGIVPVFGICLGHQAIALALGARTYKMKYGHRGGNQPVKHLESGRTYITSQNHGYAVDRESLCGTGLVVTHENQNDRTVEGMRHEQMPIVSVQYHPEGFPGPEDSTYLFAEFMKMMER